MRSASRLLSLLVAALAPSATSGVATAQPIVWFRAPLEYATGAEPRHLAVGDFNRDGSPDLAVTNAQASNVAILTGNGNGTFRRTTAYPAGVAPRWVAVWDLDGDGDEDLAVADAAPAGLLAVLLNRGDGTFDPTAYYPAGASPHCIAVADVNRDAAPDLAVTDGRAKTISLLLGNGDGTFQAPTTFTTAEVPYHLATGDFNHDGDPDLASTRPYAVDILLGNGDGTFQMETVSGGAFDRTLAIGDFNGDGHEDLAVQTRADPSGGDLAVNLGNGDGTFQPRYYVAAALGDSLAVADLNGDGRVDLAGISWTSGAVTLLGNGDGTFQPAINTEAGHPNAVVAADFNRDGQTDVATANEGSTLSIRFGRGDGTFFHTPAWPFESCASRILSADFNRDAIADLSVTRCDEQSHADIGVIAVLLGTGAARFMPPVDYDPGVADVAGDWNGDGFVDLAGPFRAGGGIATLLGNGDGTFRAGPDSPVSALTAVDQIVPGDFDGDGTTDMLLSGSLTESSVTRLGLALALGQGDGSFVGGLFIPSATDYGVLAVGVGDFDGDGNLDATFSEHRLGEDAHDVWVYFGDGAGGLLRGGSYPVGDYPSRIAVGDLNGDGRLDIVTADWSSHTVSVLLGNGGGTFQPAATYYGGGNRPSAISLADFTGDGVIDVAVANELSNNVSILPGRGDGTLTVLGASFGTLADPKDFAAGDFNNDGQLDLIAVDFYAHTLSVLTNRTQPPGTGRR